uniref:Uncharacterized protein n=1 Tax=Glossina palpalis gambiensis TaxID=67801 RepID=A0A1B0C7T5_9MUSC
MPIFGDQLALNDSHLTEFLKELGIEMGRYIQPSPPITTNVILNSLVKFSMYSRDLMLISLTAVDTISANNGCPLKIPRRYQNSLQKAVVILEKKPPIPTRHEQRT